MRIHPNLVVELARDVLVKSGAVHANGRRDITPYDVQRTLDRLHTRIAFGHTAAPSDPSKLDPKITDLSLGDFHEDVVNCYAEVLRAEAEENDRLSKLAVALRKGQVSAANLPGIVAQHGFKLARKD